MERRLPLGLFLKHRMLATPLERVAIWARSLARHYRMWGHPELKELMSEPESVEAVLKVLLKEDSNCVDVGAHIGSFLSRIHFHAARGLHTAFEPSATKARWISMKFPTARVVCAAVGQSDGMATFVENLEQPGLSYVDSSPGSMSDGTQVRMVSLDGSLAKGIRIDFIKVDVEGGELQVLRGASKILEKWQPAIMLEVGSEKTVLESGRDRLELMEFLEERKYRLYVFSDFLAGKPPLNPEEFRRCGIYPFRAFNFLAIPECVANRGTVESSSPNM